MAFIHGSVAEERERPGSDIDLIIVGEVPGEELSFAIRQLHGDWDAMSTSRGLHQTSFDRRLQTGIIFSHGYSARNVAFS